MRIALKLPQFYSLSGEFSASQAKQDLVKKQNLYFSYWAWSTPWGHVLSLKTFIKFMSWPLSCQALFYQILFCLAGWKFSTFKLKLLSIQISNLTYLLFWFIIDQVFQPKNKAVLLPWCPTPWPSNNAARWYCWSIANQKSDTRWRARDI